MSEPIAPNTASILNGGSRSLSVESTKPSRLWLWFVAAFVLQAVAWTAWLTIASDHKVQEVPLATTPVNH
jgi:hypothetical protein